MKADSTQREINATMKLMESWELLKDLSHTEKATLLNQLKQIAFATMQDQQQLFGNSRQELENILKDVVIDYATPKKNLEVIDDEFRENKIKGEDVILNFKVNENTSIQNFRKLPVFETFMKFGEPYEYQKFKGQMKGQDVQGYICLADDNIFKLELIKKN